MSNTIYPNPFSYNEIEQRSCETFYEQREATRLKPMEEVYQGNAALAFYDNYEAPTPQLAKIDGYKSGEEIKVLEKPSETEQEPVIDSTKEDEEK